ncbi:MAG: hypothetical protein AAF992_09185 [Bacteroidota bacterium]
MKIRISDNSIRLRLSRTDVAQLKEHKQVTGKTAFPGQEVFRYTLQSETGLDTIKATFMQGEITITVPQSQADMIANSDQIGIEDYLENGTDEKLFLLIEKDLKCLDGNRGDQYDKYDHPTKEC